MPTFSNPSLVYNHQIGNVCLVFPHQHEAMGPPQRHWAVWAGRSDPNPDEAQDTNRQDNQHRQSAKQEKRSHRTEVKGQYIHSNSICLRCGGAVARLVRCRPSKKEARVQIHGARHYTELPSSTFIASCISSVFWCKIRLYVFSCKKYVFYFIFILLFFYPIFSLLLTGGWMPNLKFRHIIYEFKFTVSFWPG